MEGDGRLAHAIPTRLIGPYTREAGRKFGLTLGGAFLVLAVIGYWRGHPTTLRVLGTFGILLVAGALVAPTLLRPIERAWMALARVISRVTTPIFMGAVYFILLTPIGFLRRTFGSSALVHRPGSTGVWLDRRESPRGVLDRQF
jgi:hypothetical protein